MKGVILDCNRTSGEGLIRGEDGSRYEFAASEFKSEVAPRQGLDVDFEVKEGRACAVYALSQKGLNINVGDAAERISSFAKEAGIDTAAEKIVKNFQSGPKDTIGVGLAVLAIICLFLPFVQIPFLGPVSQVQSGWGKLLFVLALAIGFLCYQGFDRKWVKGTAGSFAAIVFINSWSVISDLSDANNLTHSFLGGSRNGPNFFELLSTGFYATLVVTVLMLLSAFLRKRNGVVPA